MELAANKEERFKLLYHTINNDTSLDFEKMVYDFGPFIEEFQMHDSEGEPLFETMIKRIINDDKFIISNMDWLKRVNYNSEWSYDLLDMETSNKYYHLSHNNKHIKYMNSIKGILKSK